MSEVMREYVSRQYGPEWAKKVAKMPDYQVASIYHRMLDKEIRDTYAKEKQESERRRKEQA